MKILGPMNVHGLGTPTQVTPVADTIPKDAERYDCNQKAMAAFAAAHG